MKSNRIKYSDIVHQILLMLVIFVFGIITSSYTLYALCILCLLFVVNECYRCGVQKIVQLLYFPFTYIALLILCKETSSLHNTFVWEMLFTIIGTVYFYTLTQKTNKHLTELLPKSTYQILKHTTIYILYIVNIWISGQALSQNILISILIALVLFFLFIYCLQNNKTFLWYIGIYSISLILIIDVILCFIMWLLMLSYSKWEIAMFILWFNSILFVARHIKYAIFK